MRGLEKSIGGGGRAGFDAVMHDACRIWHIQRGILDGLTR